MLRPHDIIFQRCIAEVGKMTTFDLWPIHWGGRGMGCRDKYLKYVIPETPASYESLPAPLATQLPTLWIHTSGKGGGGGGALILDRCRAFDLFASVDAHLCCIVLFILCRSKQTSFGRFISNMNDTALWLWDYVERLWLLIKRPFMAPFL
jgi:hypothetical protein